MPTYDYRCDACHHELEIFQTMRESPRRKCPACGRMKLRRQIGNGAGILFRGSGFHQTDYRSKSYRAGAEAAKKESEPGSAGDKGAKGAKGESGG
ncbi:MAG: zinc ribbon domain-containing protein [Planctomycetota bacterium]